jgi:hypothetical protein
MQYLSETKERNARATTDRMRNAAYWAEEVTGWMQGPRNAGLSDYHVEVRAGKPVLVLGASWSDSKVSTLTEALNFDGFPHEQTRSFDGETRVFFEPADRRLNGTAHVEGLGFFPAFL